MENKELRARFEEGSVTVEAALVLTALVAILMVFISVIGLGKEQTGLCRVAGDHARNMIVSGVGTPTSPAGQAGILVQYQQDAEWVHVTATKPAVNLGNLAIGNLSCTVDSLLQPNPLESEQTGG